MPLSFGLLALALAMVTGFVRDKSSLSFIVGESPGGDSNGTNTESPGELPGKPPT